MANLGPTPIRTNHFRQGRKYPTHTPLGRRMAQLGLRAADVSAATGIYNRTLTEYLAGRKPIASHHLPYLSALLRLSPEELRGEVED